MKAGIIGCGNIGTGLALFLDSLGGFTLDYLCDVDNEAINNLQKKLNKNKPVKTTLDELIIKSDLIIESANKEVVEIILKIILKKFVSQKKLLIMSTGGLINNLDLLKNIKNCEVILPSGAIAGLDAIKAVSGKIDSLTLTTTKPIKGLEGAPFILKNGIDLETIKKEKTKKIIFDGNLEEAIEGFPKNINVAATLFLASKFDGIRIKIIADPNSKANKHEISCIGNFGKIKTVTENLPSRNPKTSYLAILSAKQSIKNISAMLKTF